MIGHEVVGNGPRRAIVLNDWLCDTSTWDAARPLLRGSPLTWAFADLRGYGRSIETRGAYTVEEAAADVAELASELGWSRFSVVGHSMSSLVALHVAQQLGEQVERVVVIGPPPPAGIGYDDATFSAVREVALGDDERRARFARAILGDRLSDGWIAFKVERWRQTSTSEAVAGYLPMFGRRGLPEPTRAIACPLLAVTGERDAPIMRRDAVTRLLSPLARELGVVELPECGHYPMQEAPPYLVHIVERFLGRGAP